MTRDEIRAVNSTLSRTRDEFRQMAEWMRTQELDRGIQRVPIQVLRLSAMADELLMTMERYARRTGLEGDPWWKAQGFGSYDEAMEALHAGQARLPEG